MPLTNRPLGMQVRGTEIYVSGQRLRHVGVNHFSLFQRELVNLGIPNTGLENDLLAIQSNGIRCVRVAFGFFSYASWKTGYYNNQALYWQTVTRVLDACYARGQGVICNVAWWAVGFAPLTYDVYGVTSPPRDFGEPSSNLWVLWSNYVTEFVTRYANHPAVWAWEPCNEISSGAGNEWHPLWKVDGTGTDQGATPLPADINFGTKPEGGTYAATDKMSWHGYQRFCENFVNICRRNDPHGRAIIGGNGMGSANAVRQRRANSLSSDLAADWAGKPETGFQPWVAYREQAFSVIASHIYAKSGQPADGQFYGGGDERTYRQLLDEHKAWADAARKPFVLEEFGALYGFGGDVVSTNPATEAVVFQTGLDFIQSADVPLACVWNWGGDRNNVTYTWMPWDITAPDRVYQISAIRALNATRG